jgi:hypothetical protein
MVRDDPLEPTRAGQGGEVGHMRFVITCRVRTGRGNELAKNGTFGRLSRPLWKISGRRLLRSFPPADETTYRPN